MLLHRNVNNEEENRIVDDATQKDGSFLCPQCSKVLIDRQSFRLHIRRCKIHNQNLNVKGKETLHKTEQNDDALIENNTEENECKTDEDKEIVNKSNCVNGRFECVFCKKTLATRTTLKYHIRLHSGKNLFNCDVEGCRRGFSKRSHLKRHMETHVKKIQQCKYCDATFDTYKERMIHCSSVHKDSPKNAENPDKELHCEQCSKCFTGLKAHQQLKAHLASHHKRFSCEICKKCFSRTDNLR